MSLAGSNVAIWRDAAPHALARPLAAAGARVLLLSSEPGESSTHAGFHAGGESVEELERLAATVCSDARPVSALVIQPRIAIEPEVSADIDPCAVSATAWRQALDGALKVPFFLARAFGARMDATGGGRIVLIAAPPAASDLVSAVACDAMVTLTSALAKAMPRSVGVHAVVARENRDAPRDAVAESVRFLLTAAALPSGTILRLDGPGT